ncbi:hypothetical protein B4N89_41795 [Embleya scabrispora]|uniref:Glycosyl hydrolase n=1 Tax=Embleya scabrispora TaxID=159449 RepID=A0A1T3NJT6_9ACTN|nr:hypothetical protein [Embleya scabrispora]OPC77103.1 hypothetical protein B4N89_41795 [Embleya scabrispora]
MRDSIKTTRVEVPTAFDADPEHRALCWTVGPTGDLAVLLVHRRHLEHMGYIKGWVGWVPKPPFDGVLVTRRSDGSVDRLPLEDVPIRPSHIALLPDARLLVAGGRAPRSEAGVWEPNTVVYSPEGEPEHSFCLGDDIPVLTTDRSGRVWTAYGDEGIYGGHPESTAGLAGWSSTGQAVWAPEGRLPDLPLQGCTAATDGDDVWLVWYSGTRHGGTFLTRITSSTGEVASWPSPVRVPDGFAVRDGRAVLTRRNHNQRSTNVTRAELDGDTWVITDERRITVPDRVVMHCGQGRDGTLRLRAGDAWVHIRA